MSEIIVYGDPLFERIRREWEANRYPGDVRVGNVIYRNLGDGNSFVAVSRVPEGGFEAAYGSQTIGPRVNVSVDKGFKTE